MNLCVMCLVLRSRFSHFRVCVSVSEYLEGIDRM